MSENPTNRDRSRHVDVKVHYLRDLVRDGHVKLVKCAGTQNVSDALTKSLARPAFENLNTGNICGELVSSLQLSLVRLRLSLNRTNGASGDGASGDCLRHESATAFDKSLRLPRQDNLR
jgi:hypothetical protein